MKTFRTDGWVRVLRDDEHRGRDYTVLPRIVCLKGQPAWLVYPAGPSHVAPQGAVKIGVFAENACFPCHLTIVYEEQPA